MQQETVTLIVAGLGIGGTLGGIVFGHFLTRSWQRKQWLLDKRTEDYQAVLTALTSAYLAITRVDTASFTSLYTDDMAREVEAIKGDAFRVLHDRIFIAEELRNAEIIKKWLFVFDSYKLPGGPNESGKAFSALTAELAQMAILDLGSD